MRSSNCKSPVTGAHIGGSPATERNLLTNPFKFTVDVK